MDLATFLQPRDRMSAQRAAAAMMLAAAGLLLVFDVAATSPGGWVAQALSWAIPALLVGMTVLLFNVPPRWLAALWLSAPLIGIGTIAALDLATRDASAGAQVFLCYPVLYAASQLRAPAAGLAAALAIAADAVVAFGLQPAREAMTSLANVGGTLLALTILLVLGGRRQDRLVAQLSRQATMDPLTGLVTRRVLDDAARAALAPPGSAGGRGSEAGTALLMMDVDRFKSINDTYGHLAGDQALVHIAALVATQCRAEDVVCRLGGDEIAMLLPECTAEAALTRAEQVVAVVRHTPLELPDGTWLTLSASVGVAHTGSGRPLTLSELFAAADEALYEAKRAGRDRAVDRRSA